MKRRKAKSEDERQYDTFSITMELERPLLYNDENNTEKKNEEARISKSKARKKTILTLVTELIISIIGFFIWLSNGYTL